MKKDDVEAKLLDAIERGDDDVDDEEDGDVELRSDLTEGSDDRMRRLLLLLLLSTISSIFAAHSTHSLNRF